VVDLWVLTHRELGPIRTFLSRDDAEAELERVFGDEPTWAGTMWIEPFRFVVAELIDR
jgi:hypothetical protein